MDTFKDLFQEIKERVRNPFLSSFVVAWLFFNWKITVALMFYDNEMLIQSGFKAYNHLIDAQQDNLKMLIYPFLSACFYVFAFPYIRNFITQFLSNRKMENENKILENSKKSSVKLERYIDLLKELETQQKLVGEIYSEQKNDLEKMALLQNDFSKEQQKNGELAHQLTEVQQAYQAFKASVTFPNALNGKWLASFERNGTIVQESWVISTDTIYYNQDDEMKISDYLYNPSTNQIHFALIDQIKEPAGHGVFYVHDKYRESYHLRYNTEDEAYVDTNKGLSMKKL